VSTSIRPPGGSGPGPLEVDGPGTSQAAEKVGTPQGSAAAASTASATQAQAAQASAAQETPTASTLRRLEAGEITREQAIDGLVAQALERHGGANLPPTLRAELAGVLRSALLEDPVLGRLLGDT
jgi:hypothetical protein